MMWRFPLQCKTKLCAIRPDVVIWGSRVHAVADCRHRQASHLDRRGPSSGSMTTVLVPKSGDAALPSGVFYGSSHLHSRIISQCPSSSASLPLPPVSALFCSSACEGGAASRGTVLVLGLLIITITITFGFIRGRGQGIPYT